MKLRYLGGLSNLFLLVRIERKPVAAEADIQNAEAGGLPSPGSAALDGRTMGTLDRCTAEINEFENGCGALVPGPGTHTLTTSSAEPLGQGRVLQNLTYTARQIIGAIGPHQKRVSPVLEQLAQRRRSDATTGRSDAMYSKALRGDVYLAEIRALQNWAEEERPTRRDRWAPEPEAHGPRYARSITLAPPLFDEGERRPPSSHPRRGT